MKKKKMIITMLILLLGFGIRANAQSEKFKALFLYNFIKNVEWPQTFKQGDFTIGILGNTPIIKELENITTSQKAGNQSMKVKVFSSPDEINNCHIIYLAPNKGSSVSQVLSKTNGNPTLIVSDSKGGIQQGAAINFILDGDKLKFEISKGNIEQKGLKVSASLLNLGITVN
ncbi:MAG: YfiR family protein [Paludibacteraceae bacterium]